jgi:hypothetical protein
MSNYCLKCCFFLFALRGETFLFALPATTKTFTVSKKHLDKIRKNLNNRSMTNIEILS